MDFKFIESLEYNWTAKVRLNNGLIITIWHTAWYSTKHTIAQILSVSSDYPPVKKAIK